MCCKPSVGVARTLALGGISWNFCRASKYKGDTNSEAQILPVLHIWGLGLRVLCRDTLTKILDHCRTMRVIRCTYFTKNMRLRKIACVSHTHTAAWGPGLMSPSEPQTWLFSYSTHFSHSSFSPFHSLPIPFLHIILTLHMCPNNLSSLSPSTSHSKISPSHR